MNRIELGCAGHCIVGHMCRWHRHTQVGRYRISTIGDYYLRDERRTLGIEDDSFFETMVFRTLPNEAVGNSGCGCQEVEEWSELECNRYATAGEAQSGHEGFVEKYLMLAADET